MKFQITRDTSSRRLRFHASFRRSNIFRSHILLCPFKQISSKFCCCVLPLALTRFYHRKREICARRRCPPRSLFFLLYYLKVTVVNFISLIKDTDIATRIPIPSLLFVTKSSNASGAQIRDTKRAKRAKVSARSLLAAFPRKIPSTLTKFSGPIGPRFCEQKAGDISKRRRNEWILRREANS